MALKIIKEQKEKLQNIEIEREKVRQDNAENELKKKRQSEAFEKAVIDQDKKKLYDEITHYRDELKNYIDYIWKYKERQKIKDSNKNQLDNFWKIKAFLKETFIEGLYSLHVLIPLAIYAYMDIYWNADEILGSMLIFWIIWLIAIFYKRSENKKLPNQDIWFIKSLWVFLWLLLYINHVKMFWFIFPWINFILFDLFFLILIPLYWFFNSNSLQSKPSYIESKKLEEIVNKQFEWDNRLDALYDLIDEISVYEEKILKKINIKDEENIDDLLKEADDLLKK